MNVSLKYHLLLASAALLVLVGMSVQSTEKQAFLQAETAQEHMVNIGIEHTEPMSMRLEFSTKGRSAMLQLSHEEGNEPALVSLPESWERQEVRGVPVHDVLRDEPSFGFVRWHIPPGTRVQFLAPEAPKEVIVHNPTGAQLKLRVVTLDLETETLNEDVYLLQDEPIIMKSAVAQ